MHPLKAAYIGIYHRHIDMSMCICLLGIYKLSDAATKKDMSEHGRHTQATEVASLNRSRGRNGWFDQKGTWGGHENILIITSEMYS